MVKGNETEPTDFTLLGFFPEFRNIKTLVFLTCTATCTGNTLLVILVRLDPQLHTPMHFLLSQLSLMDLTLAPSIIPKILTNLFSGGWNISFLACAAQIFFSLTVANAECNLIMFMCFDCYVATCKPLWYMVIAPGLVCRWLSWHGLEGPSCPWATLLSHYTSTSAAPGRSTTSSVKS